MRFRSQQEKGNVCRGRWGFGLVLLLLLSSIVSAAAFGEVGGFADVTAVQSSEDGSRGNNLKQDYSIHASRNLSPYLSLRGTLRYFRFALDQPQAAYSWREDFQPTGELTWRHPLFSFTSIAGRRISNARDALGKIYTDNGGLFLRTRQTRYPILTLRFDTEHIRNEAEAVPTETRETLYLAGADYSVARQTFAYQLSRRNAENQISDLTTRTTDHVFRWSGGSPSLAGGRLQIASDYVLRHGIVDSERPSPGTILSQIPIATGLYAEDTAPDIGELAPVPGLGDGNVSTPAEPRIDIGAGLVDRNIGADLGFSRAVSALYIYVDRPSAAGLRWEVYTSTDNLSWTPLQAPASVTWNLALSRYEIVFGTVSARYVKAVNSGLNDVVEVFVTEIAAFEELAKAERVKRSQTTHAADLTASYRFSDRVSSMANLIYQRTPLGLSDRRDVVGYALSTDYSPSRIVRHTLRWQQDFEQLGGGEGRRRTDAISYGLAIDPTEDLRFNLSGLDRVERARGPREREIRSAGLQILGSPIEPLRITGEVNGNRNIEFASDSHVDSWTATISADADLTDALNVTLGLGRQRTTSEPSHLRRLRRSYNAGFSLQVSRTILANGSFDLVRDVEESRSQDYLVSWSATRRIAVSGQAALTSLGKDYRSETYGAKMDITLNSRTQLYLSVTRLDLSGAGGSRSTLYQQGFRTSL